MYWKIIGSSDSLLELETRTNIRGHSYKLKNQRCNTTLQQHFFTFKMWTDGIVADASNLNTFKNRVSVDLFMHDYMYSLEEPPTSIRSGN